MVKLRTHWRWFFYFAGKGKACCKRFKAYVMKTVIQQVYLTEMSVCAECTLPTFDGTTLNHIIHLPLTLIQSNTFLFSQFSFAPLLFPSKSIIITKRALNTFATHTSIRSERKNRPLLSTSINRSYSCVIFVIKWRVYRWYSSIYLQQTDRKEYFAASRVQAVKKGK